MMRISRELTRNDNRSKLPSTMIIVRIFMQIYIFEYVEYLYTLHFHRSKSLPEKK